ncbi:MAG: ABC transporter ATP-binding protein [Deltaproteobacteria bacterium]|uniref:ABC transporter ATP-binding protein n=1 Tax=Candidatus Zymogenus saltonus TaxID=2844893 RepID=A0A9D8PNU1_9DELT|nr:ABC transporter ATP-binding protein [Candidatus Zymogenus saltonus]
MSENAVELRGIYKAYKTGFMMKKVEALNGVDLVIKKGEVFGYLGPNGSGKTTTLKLIMGIIYPDRGEIEVLSKSPYDISVKEKIGFLPESPYFYDYLTAVEFLDFFARLFSIPQGVRRERIRRLLKSVGLEDRADEPLRRFSRGMLQRIGIAQALINDPELVFFDEPMSGLDPLGRAEVKEIIQGLKREGKTIVFSSHILPDVEAIADRVGIIVDGKIRDVGDLDRMLNERVSFVEITVCGLDHDLLKSIEGKAEVKRTLKDRTVLLVDGAENINEVIDYLRSLKISIESVEPIRLTLEELFLSEIKGKSK